VRRFRGGEFAAAVKNLRRRRREAAAANMITSGNYKKNTKEIKGFFVKTIPLFL